jgi:hypothetical protein
LFAALALLTVGMLLASSMVWADDGKRGGDQHRDRDQGQIQVHGEHHNKDENRNQRRGPKIDARSLTAALNNQVAHLTNQATVDDDGDDADEALEADHVRVISLATLLSRFSADDAAAITNAINANAAALQTFLASGTASANEVVAALNATGVSPSSVRAILSVHNDDLIVITA